VCTSTPTEETYLKNVQLQSKASSVVDSDRQQSSQTVSQSLTIKENARAIVFYDIAAYVPMFSTVS